jgi:hypothetical protein
MNQTISDITKVAPTIGHDAQDLRAERGFAVVAAGQDHGERAPDAGEEVDRDGADDVVDLHLVQHRDRQDHDQPPDGADDQRRGPATEPAVRP